MKMQKNSPQALKTLLKMAAVLSVLLLASAASADVAVSQCSTDADCGEGFICEVYEAGGGAVAPPCYVDEDGNEVCEDEDFAPDEFEQYGECVPAPITCFSDSDCGGGLTCIFDSGDHAVDGGSTDPVPPPEEVEPGEGNKQAEEDSDAARPAPEEGFCAWDFNECESDDECGEFGECIAVGSVGCAEAAPAPDCGPDEDCDFEDREEPDCQEEEFFACVPREIECEINSDCPDSWACVDVGSSWCEGSGGSDGSDGGTEVEPDDAPDEPGEGNKDPAPPEEELIEEEPEEVECFSESEFLCVPPNFGYDTDSQNGGEETGNPFPEPNDDEEEPAAPGEDDPRDEDGGESNGQDGGEGDEDGGCTVASLGQKSTGGAMSVFLLGMLGLAVRRRR